MQYQIYLLDKKGKTYQLIDTFDNYFDAVARMRYSDGFLENNSDTVYEFISTEINNDRGVPEDTISYYIEVTN